MSYCRCGEDSDLYCYHCGESYMTHVGNVDLPYDGMSYVDTDLKAFLARVTSLRDMGYWVPDHVFDRIKREMS